ncbi:MAG: 7-carboxy-7-deazaguanine synthase [Acidimicrobiia bacterium]|nr:7-carboxy-7-deazaguanine synthase [Acidimicrobiia bacterium]
MTYLVKEVFATLQGEGANVGRVAVFCRFTGCNLWSGREEHRATAVCRFCDTDFVGTDGPGGGQFRTAAALADQVAEHWPVPLPDRRRGVRPLVVCTGGEPLLQLDTPLLDELHHRGFEVAIETNGTIAVPDGVDWVCVSPKAGTTLVVTSGDELKLVYPQRGGEPERYEHLDFTHWFLQPMDGPDRERATERAVAHCLRSPRWRLSVQTHKVVGIP